MPALSGLPSSSAITDDDIVTGNDGSTTSRWTWLVAKNYVAQVQPNAQSASYTLVLTDAAKAIELTNAGSTTITVPPNSSVAFPVGTVIEVNRLGAGALTLGAGSGVTLLSPGSLLGLRAQYSTASIRKSATDTWVVAGDLA
jgi:hypothetical protein